MHNVTKDKAHTYVLRAHVDKQISLYGKYFLINDLGTFFMKNKIEI